MKVSVIIICKNSLKTLKKCLQSVLNQSYKPFEIVVVDGASTDGTIAFLDALKNLKVINQVDTGIANARNIGVKQSNGNVIAFLDSDDTWPSHSLEIRMELLNSMPNLMAVGGLLIKSNDVNNPVPAYTPGGFVFKKEVFDSLGYFDEKWDFASDHAWFKRLIQEGYPHELIDEIVLLKGIHWLNTSILNKKAYREEMMELLRKRKNIDE